MKVYAFDVDETLEVSRGPVTIQSLKDLRAEGNIVGICGNMQVACRIPDWHLFCSFLGQGYCDKRTFLLGLSQNIVADEYVMVGNMMGRVNSLGHVCGSMDDAAANLAGWRFILEDEFAKGVR